jgi:hypothetical protein
MHGPKGEEKCIATNLGNEIILIDAINCKVLKNVKVRNDYQNVCDIALTLDNKKIICGGYGSTNLVSLEVADMATENIKCHETEHSEPPCWGQVTMDGNYLLSSNSRESIIWDVKTMKPIF